MKKSIQYFLGFNLASVIRGLRFGFGAFKDACYASLCTVHPLQDRNEVTTAASLKAIPEVVLEEMLGNNKPEIRLTIQRYEDGMLPLHEAQALLSILLLENPKEVLEIGTYMGHTARRMAENLNGSIIHTVDLPADFDQSQALVDASNKDDFHLIERRIVGREFKGLDCEKRIVQHFGDTATMDFKKIGQPTFFFIDGSHTYEYCNQDSEKCLALCSGNGTFLWHDCDEWHPGVVRFIQEWRAAGRNIVRIKGTSLAYWKSPAHSAPEK